MEGDEVAEAVAAIVLGAYGRERVPRRFWDHLVGIARRQDRPGDVVGAEAVIEAARSLRRTALAADQALRLLVALSFEVLGPSIATRGFRIELAAALGVEEANLRRYYTAGDVDTLARLLGGESFAATEPERRPGEVQAGVEEEIAVERAGGRAESSALGWHATFATLTSWSQQRNGAMPATGGTAEPERHLGEWLLEQTRLLDSGQLPLAREHRLRRYLARCAGETLTADGEVGGDPRITGYVE